jgi:hypothetical protein
MVRVEHVSWTKRQVRQLVAGTVKYLTVLEGGYFTRPQKSDQMGAVPAATPTSILSAANLVSSIT